MALGSLFGRRRFLPRFFAFIIIAAVVNLLFVGSQWKSSPRSVTWLQVNESYGFAALNPQGKVFKEGKINIDIWRKICSPNFNSLRQFPLFPHFPTERKYITIQDSLRYVIRDAEWTSARIMGHLHPPETGNYMFYLISPALVQLWLSNTSEAVNASKIVFTSLNSVKKVIFNVGNTKSISERVFLRNDTKYYFEILLAVNDPFQKEAAVVLYWMLPKTNYFVKIEGSRVSKYFNISSFYKTPNSSATDSILPSLQLSEDEDISLGKVYTLDKNRSAESKKLKFTLKQDHIKQMLGEHLDVSSTDYNRENVGILPFIDRPHNSIVNAFERCTYNPAYTKNRFIKRYEGVWSTYFNAVFPNDGSNVARLTMPPFHGYNDFIRGNYILEEKEVLQLVKTFMETLNLAFPRKYTLNSIVNIERYSPEQIKGKKYLIELVLRYQKDNKPYRFSQFFFDYQKQNQTSLCFLSNLQWNPRAWVNVILNVKSQAGWILSFVQEMRRILKQSRDQYVNFIIADYGNKGIDIAKEMERHGIKNFNVFKKTGAFHKTSSINMAASKVNDPNSIILLMDLHLSFPANIFDMVRKHTIQGKTGFSPILMRLSFCGRPKTKYIYPRGYYEPNGFGIFATYKSDWDSFGGMNEKEFKSKWGGEDWEMVDRFLMKGYEIEKLRLPGFYHFFHDKVGMWN